MFDIFVLLLALFISISGSCLPGIYCNNIIGEYRMERTSCDKNGLLIDSTSTLGNLVKADSYIKCIGDEDIGIKTNYDSKFTQSLAHLPLPLKNISFSLWFKGYDAASSFLQITNPEENLPLLSLRFKKMIYYNSQTNKYDSIIFKNITLAEYNNEVIVISTNTITVYINSKLVFTSEIHLLFNLFNSSSILEFFTSNNMMFYYFSIYNEALSKENIENNFKIGFQPSYPDYYSQNPIITIENNEADINMFYIWKDEYDSKPMISNVIKFFKIEITPPNIGFIKVNHKEIVSPSAILIDNFLLSYTPPQDTFNDTEYK